MKNTLASAALLLVLATTAVSQEAFTKSGTYRIEPNEAAGFSYPYYVFLPKTYFSGEKDLKTILVAPNNTGTNNDDLAFHEKSVKRKMFQAAFVFNRLGVAVLMPVFPRPKTDWRIYTHALDRDAMTTKKQEYARFDLQLAAMIDDARRRLGESGIKTNEKVLLYGYSASGMFANRFAFLHPKRVKAATIGSPGGWPIVPSGMYNEKPLRYPIGVYDMKEITGRKLDIESLRKVPMFLYLGDQDDNDSVKFRDSYDKEDETLIFELFGRMPVDRWDTVKKLYKDAGLNNAEFKLYPGVDHKPSNEMRKDVLEFLTKHKD